MLFVNSRQIPQLKYLSPRAVGGQVISEGISLGPFNYFDQNGYLKIFIRPFWRKRLEGLLPSNLFGHLKLTLELLISIRMSPHTVF